jgi:DNA-binding NarL/FixJ family response regulator
VIRVLLADDQGLLRSGLRSLLADDPGIHVVAEASDGDEALALTREHTPDVVLMDIRMPGTDGLAATRAIAADPRLATVRVVILTTFDLDDYIFESLRNGASGFLLKDAEPDELIRAVHTVAAGDSLLSPRATRALVAEYATRSRPPPRSPAHDLLTQREQEVLGHIAAGLPNHEIATRLTISPTTAKAYVSRIITKLGARDRAQLVVYAYETGFVTPGWSTDPAREDPGSASFP